MVVPKLIPRIWVCTAPDEPTVQRSLLMLVIVGATAVGGGDFTVVVVSFMLRDNELEFVVDSVTMTWALTDPMVAIITNDGIIFTVFDIV
jgi:hypothetical protein